MHDTQTVRSTKYIHNLIAMNPADYINKHTTTLCLSFLSLSAHTHTHTHTHTHFFYFFFYFVRSSRRRLHLLEAFEFRAVFCLQPNLHQSYGVLDGNVGHTRVTTGVVLQHELPRLGWLTVVKTGYQKKKHRQCQNAAVCSQ